MEDRWGFVDLVCSLISFLNFCQFVLMTVALFGGDSRVVLPYKVKRRGRCSDGDPLRTLKFLMIQLLFVSMRSMVLGAFPLVG